MTTDLNAANEFVSKTKLSLDSTEQEIEAQVKDVPNYVEFLDSLSWEKIEPEDAILVGAGDSLACANFVERLTGFEARSIDPYDLLRNSGMASGKFVYFVSISGKTKSNIEAAEAVKKLAKKTVAVTSNPESQLAKTCTELLPLKFSKEPGLTPGTNSFTTSLVACSRVFGVYPNFNLGEVIRRAKQWAKRSKIAGMVHFVSSGSLYPIAMYAAAKVFEFTGDRADYQLTEEFSHMNLFSMSDDDCVIIIKSDESDLAADKLNQELVNQGFDSQILNFDESDGNMLERAISCSIHLQYLALNFAINKGLKQPAFLQNERLLGISNRMIY
jgi:fructoselysine-6-P-deglycase FrlB-like protein